MPHEKAASSRRSPRRFARRAQAIQCLPPDLEPGAGVILAGLRALGMRREAIAACMVARSLRAGARARPFRPHGEIC